MGGEFDFELPRVIEAISARKCKTVLLQFPEGLKRRAHDVVLALGRETDALVIVSGEPCFGACDIPDSDADLLVHFGHLPIGNLHTRSSVLFIQARSTSDPEKVLDMAAPKLEGRVGLLTSAQHIHQLDAMAGHLRSKGLEVLVGKGGPRLFADGQVLGCNASSARAVADRADSFLFVGSGNFHALAIALATPKPVLVADPELNEVRDIADIRDRMLRQRHAAIERARTAKRFGIILSSKQGQRRGQLARRVQDMLASVGLEPMTVELGTVTPQKLESFGVEAWVSTACPRLALDDFNAFTVPVLTAPEVEIMVGKRSWDDYVLDEME